MSTPAPRRPRPPKRPETLVELVLDLEERSPGEPDAAIELPAQEWAHLVARAQQELAIGYRPGAVSGPALLPAPHPADDHHLRLRNDLADALGWGRLNSENELLQVVRGYVMAHELERDANEWSEAEARLIALVGPARAAHAFLRRLADAKNVMPLLGEIDEVAAQLADVLPMNQEPLAIERAEQVDEPEESPETPKPTMVETAEKNDAEEAAREVYCRSCRKWFPHGTHAPHKAKSAQAELAQP